MLIVFLDFATVRESSIVSRFGKVQSANAPSRTGYQVQSEFLRFISGRLCGLNLNLVALKLAEEPFLEISNAFFLKCRFHSSGTYISLKW